MNRSYLCARFSFGAILSICGFASAGNLNPPGGPVTATMKTLQEVEPRVPVQSLSGSATAVYSITQPGSYYLTGDILGAAGKNGIEIANVQVTLDLSGFNVTGVPGALTGIVAGGGASVRNGAVNAWPGGGVNVCNVSQLQALSATGNGNYAFVVCRGNVVDCVAQQNQNGFQGFGAVFQNCHAVSNSGQGFSASNGSALLGCAANGNSVGIVASGGSLVGQSTAFGNSTDGIQLSGTSRAVENMVGNNTGSGILAVGNLNTIDLNSVTQNGTGVRVSGTGNLITRNNARGNTTGFNIAASNDYGVILSSPGAAFTSSAAWANFADGTTPSCSDGIKNGGETDVDCGGATACPRCGTGKMCVAGSDCVSGVCQGGMCQAPPGFCNSSGDCASHPNMVVSCVSNQCQYACNMGYSDCNANQTDGCEVYTLGDTNNCGNCGHVCPGTQTCVNGVCQ